MSLRDFVVFAGELNALSSYWSPVGTTAEAMKFKFHSGRIEIRRKHAVSKRLHGPMILHLRVTNQSRDAMFKQFDQPIFQASSSRNHSAQALPPRRFPSLLSNHSINPTKSLPLPDPLVSCNFSKQPRQTRRLHQVHFSLGAGSPSWPLSWDI